VASPLASWAWSEAACLLVSPPDPGAAVPWSGWPAQELLEAFGAAAALPDGPIPQPPPAGLVLELLRRPWRGAEQELLRRHADALRRQLVGDTVTYVVNRNLNVSNHCVQHCSFCAFRRDPGEPGAYWLHLEELQERARQAQSAGATELCLQAGLNPAARLGGSQLAYAERLLRALLEAAPGIHLHAFSPQELVFFAEQDGVGLDAVLERLQAAGLGSVPGTAAEVLSERVRRVLCPEKLSARAWVAAMLQIHRRGLASTSTLMAGHIESPADLTAHLLTLVALQASARRRGVAGFSEFVLLPFVGEAAPAPLRARVGRDQPDRTAMLRLTAQARLVLSHWIPAHQPSWVKLSLDGATEALRWGCNDLGGTLMEEHITTMAGARGGTRQTPAALAAAAGSLGRPARQRTTLYGRLP
jgi:FO synthase subunit 2